MHMEIFIIKYLDWNAARNTYPTYRYTGFLARIEKLSQPFDRSVYWVGPIPMLCLKKHDDIAVSWFIFYTIYVPTFFLEII